MNGLITSNLVDNTPYEAWDIKIPSLSHLKVFGCDAFVHIPKEIRQELDSTSEKCIFIEYNDGVKGYKLWNPTTMTIVYRRDVIFRYLIFREDESSFETEEVTR